MSTSQTLKIACLLCAAMLPAVVNAQFTLTTNNGAITIIGYTGPGGDVTIPSVITGLPVAGIGAGAFFNNGNLTGVTIPNSVTSIGDDAFESCGNLGSVTIPASVTNIGTGPFANCGGLSAITVAAGNPAYVDLAGVLFDKAVTRLISYPGNKPDAAYTIPNGVRSIADSACWGCPGLASVTIPSGVTNIGSSAFFLCNNLTNIAIPNTVIQIGQNAFQETALVSVTLPNSVTSIGPDAFRALREPHECHHSQRRYQHRIRAIL